MFSVVALLSLLGMAAIVVDVGYGFLTKRRAQAAADASALAAAQFLPESTTQASSASSTYAAKNFSGSVTASFSNTYTPNDTVSTSANADAPSFFGNLFGFSKYAAGATAKVTVGSYTGYGNNLAPWTIDRTTAEADFGQSVNFKVPPQGQVAPGNFGAVNLPLESSGCGLSNGTSDYRNLINGSDHSCLVRVGDQLQSETGNMGTNTGNALQARNAQTPFDPNTVLSVQPDGTSVISNYSSPNVIVIPVVNAFSNGATTFTVTTFAWFIITKYNSNSVWGMFVRSSQTTGALCPTATNPNNPCPIGAYDPDGIKIVELSG